MIEKQDELNIVVSQLSNGATIIDCGVNVDGSFKAGEPLYTKVCLGGLKLMLEFLFLVIYLKIRSSFSKN